MPDELEGLSTLGDALDHATRRLEAAAVPDARQNALLLLCHVLEIDRGVLLTRRGQALDPEAAATFAESIRRRERREPLQHIIGSQEFYGLPFQVDGRALVPRSETEGLVDATLALDLPNGARVADLGTGTGCIAIALAVKRRDLELYALERSPAALSLARANAARHDVEDRIEFHEGPMAAPPEDWWERMDAVVCNPPYVSEEEWGNLEPEVRDYDPREALVPGATGLEGYQELVPAASDLLRPEGSLVLELGQGQADAVRELVTQTGLRLIEIRDDLQGIPRVLVAEKP